ncbi:MAG TPA: malto-oligosyltrehalose trehalohydrolase [Steroidobacteraceae bacterium]|jgi:maltooligosyltrehalose trehalohydrolase|nr:malto-oligosyltrehalose trehalohydrolase [Steroidobacteraceae bacterium]
MIFSVWAPNAKSVELIAGGQRVALRALDSGYWQAEVAVDRRDGYRYSIDGAAPLPDPRSRWQPAGVHGASHIWPLPAHMSEGGRFTPAALNEAVIYELHIGTFTAQGTYAAAQTKLPHLCALGVTHVELMPLATFPGRHGWGYDGVDLFAPFPGYGTPAELAALVQACHACGLAVLLDVVYNHLGPDGNYLAQFGPYFTERYSTGWGAAINYDGAHSDEVRRFVIDNARMWLRDYGFDGLRLDAVHAIFSFEALHVLEELSAAVKALGEELKREFVLIAESDLNDPRLVHSVARGGYGLDAHWADDFHHAIHRFFTGENQGYYADFHGLRDVATALRDGYVYQGQYSAFRGRRHGRAPQGVAARQLVVSAQNHDQIGNRAQGERLSMMLDLPELKAIAALTLLSPFVPLLFQGEEWGAATPFQYFTDHQDPELGRLVAEGRSREFSAFRWQGAIPNPQDPATFARSKLDWTELSLPRHAELFDWYRKLIRLRRDRVRTPRESRADSQKSEVDFDAAAEWLAFVHNGVLAVFNLGDRAQCIPMPAGEWRLVLRSDAPQAWPVDAVAPRATLIYLGG